MEIEKYIKVQEQQALLIFEGKDFKGVVGIDSRIFKSLSEEGINVGIIAQEAAERGISLLIDEKDADRGQSILIKEFQQEIIDKYVDRVYTIKDLCSISVKGQKFKDFNKPFQALVKNQIFPLIINNNIAGESTDFVIKSEEKQKTLNILQTVLFENPKQLHLVVIGPGNVGKTLINQILESADEIQNRKRIKLKVVGIANSRKMLFNKDGVQKGWLEELEKSDINTNSEEIVKWTKQNQLENLVLVDNTASKDFVVNYDLFLENGFDLVSSNKIFNTLPIAKYKELRKKLDSYNKRYLYETNVGAGLPLIDNLKLLHLSGENVTRIKGVFSGTLSYIFNNFSVRDEKFSTIVKEAMDKGFTEPDPREDLSGNDVARKLLILARELDLINEFEDINVQNLIPEHLTQISKQEFLERLEELDEHYENVKKSQQPNHVLRYVGDLHGDLQKDKGILDVKLVSVPASSSLGQVKGSDSIFEIYTESYGENPVVIMGAGAGAKVTARGVFGDILRLSENK